MNNSELFTKLPLDAWKSQLNQANKLIDGFTDEQLNEEIAPGRNTVLYILGHLTAVSDNLIPLLGFGEKKRPELFEIFIKNPDKSSLQKPTAKQLREDWKQINAFITSKLEALTPDQWLEKHTSVSEEDFKKEPHRNKLNVVLGRTNHLAYHVGQLALIKK